MVSYDTMMFKVDKDHSIATREILKMVIQAMNEKGYDAIDQIVGYILSGDPTYITNHLNARNMIRRMEREELLEEFVKYYLASL